MFVAPNIDAGVLLPRLMPHAEPATPRRQNTISAICILLNFAAMHACASLRGRLLAGLLFKLASNGARSILFRVLTPNRALAPD